MVPCSYSRGERYQGFERICCINLQDRTVFYTYDIGSRFLGEYWYQFTKLYDVNLQNTFKIFVCWSFLFKNVIKLGHLIQKVNGEIQNKEDQNTLYI
jgi:hypothetical protein